MKEFNLYPSHGKWLLIITNNIELLLKNTPIQLVGSLFLPFVAIIK
jgi:hypothetical protein